jgi:F-type H+-transporting ATPase subunit delta
MFARGGSGNRNGRVDVSSSASLTSGVAGRYATALFEIAKEGGSLQKVESDILAVEAALAESSDLRDMIASPVFSREDMGAAIKAISARMDLGQPVASTLGLMAANRRLFVLPGLVAAMKGLFAAERGEVTAEVTAARPLTDAQIATLRDTLKASVGKDVGLAITVNPDLIGGLVVKVGSRMIDSSIRSKLANLQNVMKEVG